MVCKRHSDKAVYAAGSFSLMDIKEREIETNVRGKTQRQNEAKLKTWNTTAIASGERPTAIGLVAFARKPSTRSGHTQGYHVSLYLD